MKTIGLLGVLIGMVLAISVARADDPRQEMNEVDGWRQSALQSLDSASGPVTEAVLDAHRYLRCIKLNNYTCIRLAKSAGFNWCGQIGLDYGQHVAFKAPEYSIRSQLRDYLSKAKRGVVTARQISVVNQPWCDTLGSVAVRLGWGRSCDDDGAKPPADFDGKLCKRPADGKPSREQCRSCNCPDEAGSASMVSGITKADRAPLTIDDDLKLFTADWNINKERAKDVLRNVTRKEIGGLFANDDVFERAFALPFGNDCD